MVLAGGYGCCHCYLATVERSMLISTAAVLYSFFCAEKSVFGALRLWKWAPSWKPCVDQCAPLQRATFQHHNLFNKPLLLPFTPCCCCDLRGNVERRTTHMQAWT